MNSKPLQATWGLLHFCVMGLFLAQALMFVGTSMWALFSRLVAGDGRAWRGVPGLNKAHILAYSLAGMIVLYTMLVSCLVDVGVARQRLPTDGLILMMVFIGAHVLWCSANRLKETGPEGHAQCKHPASPR